MAISSSSTSRGVLPGASPVRFAECDSYGVVWHGHYALYLEQAREALTGRFGFTATPVSLVIRPGLRPADH